MMVHFPSFIVGGMFSGAAFLFVHEQVSHRSKLSNKWIVREMAEQKWREIKAGARDRSDSSQIVRSTSPSFEKEWNKAIFKLQDAFKKDS